MTFKKKPSKTVKFAYFVVWQTKKQKYPVPNLVEICIEQGYTTQITLKATFASLTNVHIFSILAAK